MSGVSIDRARTALHKAVKPLNEKDSGNSALSDGFVAYLDEIKYQKRSAAKKVSEFARQLF